MHLYRGRSRSDASKPNNESNQNLLVNNKYELNISTTATTPTNGESNYLSINKVILQLLIYFYFLEPSLPTSRERCDSLPAYNTILHHNGVKRPFSLCTRSPGSSPLSPTSFTHSTRSDDESPALDEVDGMDDMCKSIRNIK